MNLRTLLGMKSTNTHDQFARFGSSDPGNCQHEWREREQWHQKMRADGKTIWICRRCHTINSTYSWHKPR